MISGLQGIFDSDDDGLLETPEKAPTVTSSDRLERSFLEIVEFRRVHGRLPQSDIREIAERKLGARLDGILANDAKIEALKDLDEFGLLNTAEPPASLDDLLGSGDGLDLLSDHSGLLDTSTLPRVQRNDPDEVAQRVRSDDFDRFEPLFAQKHGELDEGTAKLVPFSGVRQIVEGAFFVVGGVMAFVAEVRAPERSASGATKERLRCVFENGTESSMYRQSLSTRLYEDGGFVVTEAEPDLELPEEEATGWIYVLRSLSDDPQIERIEDLHKIGFSRGPVEARISRAEHESTYLMAPVEIVAAYRTYNLKASRLENLLHRVFAEVRLDVDQVGKDGRVYEPSEWFVAPLAQINRAIEHIVSGEIVDYLYDRDTRQLIPRPELGRAVGLDSV